ncbi:hypothetical protein EJ08DRAFT_628366 [Tothia fuscella]|uniref:Ubiquinol-cytochrome-c reductase complex assembly factor 2 n=1 Tax=Tothia fuscella TaxID=1048955 RepID=A0A9P4U274_9PEZI|nr:hypothetical protein EJ08DRAFT_628366 [Tothia fuscella]
MSRASIPKHYSRILQSWPKDPLRPEVSFQKVIERRLAAAQTVSPESEATELRNINALYSLLDNRYRKKYPAPARLFKPTSNPAYYDDLIHELSQAPNRSWLQRFMTKLKGTIRLS